MTRATAVATVAAERRPQTARGFAQPSDCPARRGLADGKGAVITPAPQRPTAPHDNGLLNPPPVPAVLYVCASPDGASGIGTARATEEGRAFAELNDMRIVSEITDAYGEPIPWKRSGWAKVREMAEESKIEVALVRWPNAISPVPELRPPELDYLGQHGVQIRYTSPLAIPAREGVTR